MASKSYRKFMATGVTAAVVASAVAPVASASYADVQAGSWYEGAVNYVTEAGYMSGTNKGFEPNKTMTRAEAATLFANMGDLYNDSFSAGFSDVTDGAWYHDAVAAVKEYGIMGGSGNGEFSPNRSLTRGEVAALIVRAYGLEVEGTATHSFTDINNSMFKNDIAILAEFGIANGAGSADKFAPNQTITRAEMAAFIQKADIAVANLAPEVLSVSAINAKQVVVNFNTTVNSDAAVVGDASEAALYTLDGVPASSAVVSADKKSVTLTFAADVEGTDQVLVVNPIATNAKDEDGAWVTTEKYSGIFSYTDSVKPVITSTSYANGKITLNFSEDLSALPTVVRVNGVPVTTFDFAAGSKSKVEVTTTLAAGTTASLYVAGAKDDANTPNLMDLYNGSVVTPGSDTEKPRVSSFVVTGQNTAKVTLSEAVVETSINATLQKGATQTPVTLVKDTTDTTGKTYTLTVDLNGATAGDGIFAGTSTSETFTLYVAANAMTDVAGLKNDLYSTSLTFVKDTTAPSVTSSQVGTDNKKLEFTFSEALTVVGADSSIVITNGEGVRIVAVDAETALKTGDNKTYQIDTKATDVALDAGTYNVSIPAGFFTDAYGNASAAVTGTFTVGAPSTSDTVKPTATVATTATNTFTVTYSEEVTSSGLSLANYKLDGQALPTGTDIYFTDSTKKVVVIALPTNTVNFGSQSTGAAAVLAVSGVTDKAGNAINASYYDVTVKDNTAATITGVQVIGQDVYVTFSEVLAASTADADLAFDITVNGAPVTAGVMSAVAGNNKQVKFTLDANPAGTPVVTVKAGQITLTDANGVAVK